MQMMQGTAAKEVNLKQHDYQKKLKEIRLRNLPKIESKQSLVDHHPSSRLSNQTSMRKSFSISISKKVRMY